MLGVEQVAVLVRRHIENRFGRFDFGLPPDPDGRRRRVSGGFGSAANRLRAGRRRRLWTPRVSGGTGAWSPPWPRCVLPARSQRRCVSATPTPKSRTRTARAISTSVSRWPPTGPSLMSIPELGLVRVVSIDTAQDVGKVLNPQSVVGQIEGGTMQGVGLAVMEELIVDQGIVRNANFTDYLLPTFLDAPPVASILIEEPGSWGPFGAKGFSELPTISSGPAVMAAIRAATGKALTRMPVRPEDIALDATELSMSRREARLCSSSNASRSTAHGSAVHDDRRPVHVRVAGRYRSTQQQRSHRIV